MEMPEIEGPTMLLAPTMLAHKTVVLARDLKALGLYAARSLSYEGVEYELVEHKLTDEQIHIYDEYAGAFSIIHNNLDAAMRAANVTGASGTLNAQAKSAARSAFESAKQRFFNHLITVTDRQTIYTHPGTAVETRLLTITQRDRTRPVTLDDALAYRSDPRATLLVNTQSGRAAVQVPARSVMLDDGQVERRVRLIRPMEHPVMPLAVMPQTHWKEADRNTFARAWSAELADVPAFTDSEIHIVAGLLLPIWKRLPNESTRVYRLQTDTGERIIGRKVSPAWVASATAIGVSALTPEATLAALLDGKTILDLAEGLQLRRVRVMGANRIELTGFTDAMRERLSAYGLFHEIISWKLRMFIPTDAAGIDVLRKVLERYPVARIAERAV